MPDQTPTMPTLPQILPSAPVVTPPTVPVLPASRNRVLARFWASASLAIGGLIVGLPQIVPTIQQILPSHAKQIGWAAIVLGWIWNSVQRGLDTHPDKTQPVNYTPPAI